jgi:hypothetical protein
MSESTSDDSLGIDPTIIIRSEKLDAKNLDPFNGNLTEWREGFDPLSIDDSGSEDIILPVRDIDPENIVAGYGRIITLKAAKKMISGKWSKLISDFNTGNEIDEVPNLFVTFSKQMLLLLLSQPECEGIKAYFCKNPMGEDSLVLIGVDKKGQDLIGTSSSERSGTLATNVIEANKYTSKALIIELGGPYG